MKYKYVFTSVAQDACEREYSACGFDVSASICHPRYTHTLIHGCYLTGTTACLKCEKQFREAGWLVLYALLPHLMSKLYLVICISRCFILQPSLSRNKMLMMNDHSLRGIIHVSVVQLLRQLGKLSTSESE